MKGCDSPIVSFSQGWQGGLHFFNGQASGSVTMLQQVNEQHKLDLFFLGWVCVGCVTGIGVDLGRLGV